MLTKEASCIWITNEIQVPSLRRAFVQDDKIAHKLLMLLNPNSL